MPHDLGMSRTFKAAFSWNVEVREEGSSQALGIFAKTESRFDFASSCQLAIAGVVDMAGFEAG